MTKKLWQNTKNLNQLIEEYTSGDDVLLDQHLVAFDIFGSLAHATMLHKQNLIEAKDFKKIKKGLHKIYKDYQSGTFNLKLGDEDVHTRVEHELTKMASDSGAKLHLGRSRNDQVLTDIRLFSKQQLILIAQETGGLITLFLDQAQAFKTIPLPGMTHMQPAMLSSFGLWLSAFAESLLDDLQVLEAIYELTNQSPLGSGAAYGVTLPIDRQMTADLLGFAKVQNNALYCQNSRGKIEAVTLHALSQVMATLNKFATDCLLFTTEPFAFISFDKNLGTGSSIMPQKQNWDALELLRAKYHQVIAEQINLSTSLASIPSGYNRDLQQTKGSLITAFSTTLQSIQVAKLHVESLQIHQKTIEQHIPQEIFAAHWAYTLVQEKHMPFRQAYMYVKNHLEEMPHFDVNDLLNQAISQGSTGNLQLGQSRRYARRSSQHWDKENQQFTKKLGQLIQK